MSESLYAVSGTFEPSRSYSDIHFMLTSDSTFICIILYLQGLGLPVHDIHSLKSSGMVAVLRESPSKSSIG